MTSEEAVAAIRNAADWREASSIRNQIAFEAMKKLRPEADADACRAAYFERWNADLVRQHVAPQQPLHWTGD